jgi:hypothetical protein
LSREKSGLVDLEIVRMLLLLLGENPQHLKLLHRSNVKYCALGWMEGGGQGMWFRGKQSMWFRRGC